jgi:hypothetical protein
MCFLWGKNWVFISQKTDFFTVTAVKISNLSSWTYHFWNVVSSTAWGRYPRFVPRESCGYCCDVSGVKMEDTDEKCNPLPTPLHSIFPSVPYITRERPDRLRNNRFKYLTVGRIIPLSFRVESPYSKNSNLRLPSDSQKESTCSLLQPHASKGILYSS